MTTLSQPIANITAAVLQNTAQACQGERLFVHLRIRDLELKLSKQLCLTHNKKNKEKEYKRKTCEVLFRSYCFFLVFQYVSNMIIFIALVLLSSLQFFLVLLLVIRNGNSGIQPLVVIPYLFYALWVLYKNSVSKEFA